MSDPLVLDAFATLRLEGNSSSEIERFTSLSAFLERYPELELTGKVTRGDIQAFGGYSDVYIGTYLDPTDNEQKKIAIKSMRIFIDRNKDFERAVVRELDIWRRLKHPNIHSLMGYAKVDGLPSFISIWMDKSTVSRYIKENDISMVEKYRIVKGISEGLCYLHDGGIVHSDLKTDNILINVDGSPILADFGVSRMLFESHTVTGTKELKGCVRYMAIELLTGPRGVIHCLHTKATDVWGFGMVAYEILSGNIPYHDSPNEPALIKSITDGIVPKQTHTLVGVDFVVRLLTEKMWSRAPEDRPNMKEVNEAMVTLLSWKSDEAKLEEGKHEEYLGKLLESKIVAAAAPLISIATTPGPLRVAFSPDADTFAATFSACKTLQVFSTRSGESLFGEMNAHKQNVTAIDFSKDGLYIASHATFDSICVWNAKNGLLISQVQESTGGFFSFEFLHSEDDIQLGVSTGGALSKYHPLTGELISKSLCSDIIKDTQRPLISNNGDCIYDWSEKGNHSYWLKYSQSGLKLGQIVPPPGPFSILAATPTAKITYRQVIHWESAKIVRYYTITQGVVLAEVWDMRTLSNQGDIAQLGPIRVDSQDRIQVSCSGDIAVLYDLKGYIQFFSLVTGKPICAPTRIHCGNIRNVAFSKDDSKLISTSIDGTIRVWDISRIYKNQ